MTAKRQEGGSNGDTGASVIFESSAEPEPPEDILDRLRVCLDAVRTTNDLGRREMRVTERAIRQLDRHGMATTANEFWESTALPRAQRLVDESKRVIERELALLAKHHPDTEPELAVASLPSTAEINDLGAWWQRRLRRSALLRSIPTIATNTPARAEFLIANKEMMLLDRPPWSHSDRLLSAFELAHGQIARYGRRRVTELLSGDPLHGESSGGRARDLLVESTSG